MKYPISILPGDERTCYLADFLKKKGGSLCSSWDSIPLDGYLVCGIPFTRDGRFLNTSLEPKLSVESFLGMLTPGHILIAANIPASVARYCIHHGIKYYDIQTSEELAVKNARLTAEGLLIPLLSHTKYSISDFVPLVVGYGKCGKEIARILNIFVDDVYVCDNSTPARKKAKSDGFYLLTTESIPRHAELCRRFNILINTAPCNPFSENGWRYFSKHCKIFQVASTPLPLPLLLSENLITCPEIPVSYAPKTAGSLIAEEICRHFKL